MGRLIAAIGRYFERTRSRLGGRRGTEYTLTHDPERLVLSWLTLEDEHGQLRIPWGTVTRIEAFKRDLYAVDLICLALETERTDAVVIHEEMAGWQTLLEALPGYLPGFPPEGAWLRQVALPAFETNQTTLFTRGPQLRDQNWCGAA